MVSAIVLPFGRVAKPVRGTDWSLFLALYGSPVFYHETAFRHLFGGPRRGVHGRVFGTDYDRHKTRHDQKTRNDARFEISLYPGLKSGGAISKPANSKPGATVQPTSVQAPRLSADCHQDFGTTI
jgi:hypothetical protein